MIAVRLEGRLGNQLFQYAFVYAAAKKLNTKFYLDKHIDYLLLDKYFNIPSDFCRPFDRVFSIQGFKNIFSHHLRRRFYVLLENLFALKQVVFDNNTEPEIQIGLIKDKAIYHGFFQSEQYFADYKTDLLNLFSIKEIYKNKFQNIFRSLPAAKQYVTVHIRRGDYIDHNLALDVSYYHDAINQIHNDGNYYIFISDDPEFVKKEFNYLLNSYVSEHDEITDLQFLMHADICILSNSSFSWWGAWLNNNQKKQVYAPKYWLGFKTEKEFPIGISDHLKINWVTV
jgi:hypothetical protein